MIACNCIGWVLCFGWFWVVVAACVFGLVCFVLFLIIGCLVSLVGYGLLFGCTCLVVVLRLFGALVCLPINLLFVCVGLLIVRLDMFLTLNGTLATFCPFCLWLVGCFDVFVLVLLLFNSVGITYCL